MGPRRGPKDPKRAFLREKVESWFVTTSLGIAVPGDQF